MVPPHIVFDEDAMQLKLLDQRLLPLREAYVACRTWEDVAAAIRDMVVRGAPAIGIAAAYGCVLAARQFEGQDRKLVDEAMSALAAARPTAVNLAWAVGRMRAQVADGQRDRMLTARLLDLARSMEQEDIDACKAIGLAGAPLVPDGGCVLTHCNAGALATAGYGTALGVLRAALEQGKSFRVIADETRPLLQGSRLTAYELAADGIDVRIACDNACAALMAMGQIQMVVAGADRIAANGDTANKIGTLGTAVLARHFGVPFYIAAPLSTVDISLDSGAAIPIEVRRAEEVVTLAGTRIAPLGVEAINMAFDVTPASLISGIITEAGVLRPPFHDSIGAALKNFAHGVDLCS